jgi:hypothetical protein
MNGKSALLLLIFVLANLTSSFAIGAEMNQATRIELFATLQTFSKKHGLSDEQLQEVLSDVVLNSAQVEKGGIGVVDKDDFLVLREARNSLVASDKRWQGRPSGETEIVLTDGKEVVGVRQKLDLSKLKIVLFSPEEVRFINLSGNSGGKYLRTR